LLQLALAAEAHEVLEDSAHHLPWSPPKAGMFLLASRRLLYWFLVVNTPDFLERVSLSKRSTRVPIIFPGGFKSTWNKVS